MFFRPEQTCINNDSHVIVLKYFCSGISFIRAKLGTQYIVGETDQDLVDTEIDDDDNPFFQVKKNSSVSELELFLDSPSDKLAIYL